MIKTFIDKVEEDKSNIKKAMDILNETYKLNVLLDCSIDVGKSYSEIH